MRDRIDELVETQRAMGRAAEAARRDASHKGELVAMRRRFAEQVAAISGAIDMDRQLRADPALQQEFRNRFAQMRSMVQVHQAKWPAVLLDDGNPEFRLSADTVIANNRAFAAWAKSVLE